LPQFEDSGIVDGICFVLDRIHEAPPFSTQNRFNERFVFDIVPEDSDNYDCNTNNFFYSGTDLETIFPFYQISFLRGNEVSVRINQGFIEGNYNESDDSWEVIVDILIPGDGEDVPFQFTQIFRRSR